MKLDDLRDIIRRTESAAQRTFTPTLAVIESSAGVFHFTTDGKKLFDYTSGVLVANLGHNSIAIHRRTTALMGWDRCGRGEFEEFFDGVPLTAYNAITPVEAQATKHLIEFCSKRPGGSRLQKLLWAASGAEAIQKALWAAMALDRTRPMILATRFGFHGKKGLSGAVTGSEADSERDPRVRFISFPMKECLDLSLRDAPFDVSPYRKELDDLWHQFGAKIGTLITEPYLGGAGSYHPPKAYLQMLQAFCREKGIVFILDEVQANFGRCGEMFAFEAYGLEPDVVVLGKGLGNGVPVAATIGRADVMDALTYGEASDTWSANPLSCAAVQATLEVYESRDVLGPMREASAIIEAGLVKLKEFACVMHVRGEKGGMVWGVEFSTPEHANAFVLEAYREGVHLLGPLAKKVVRISPPLIITAEQAREAGACLECACRKIR